MATIYVATTGNDTTGNGTSGNPYATPGKAASVKATGDTVQIAAGTYTMTTASTNVAGGCVSDTANTNGTVNKWIGTGTVIFKAGVGVTSCSLFATGGTHHYIENIQFDGSSNTSVTGLNIGSSYDKIYNCKAYNCPGSGFYGGGYQIFINCLAYSCNVGLWLNGGGLASFCTARNNTGSGFWGNDSYGSEFANCVSYSNGGWGFSGQYSSTGQFIRACIAYGNSNGGFDSSGTYARMTLFEACIAYGNTGYGYNGNGTNVCINCAAGGNTSGSFNSVSVNNGSIALSADPFNNASTGDFNLNSTAGGGALLVPSAANFALPW